MKCILVIVICFFTLSSNAQADLSAKTWFYIDSSLNKKHDLSALLVTIKELQAKAIAEQQYLPAARCLNYAMQVNDLKTEDSLYFKNSSFIDEMLLQPVQSKPMQYALHLMQAKRLIGFNKRYKRFDISRYERKDILINYAAYGVDGRDSIAQWHFEKAKVIAKDISQQNIEEALWLSSDALQFLFKPGLFDIAIAEQINTSGIKTYYPNPLPSRFSSWMQLPPDEFIVKIDSVIGRPGKLYKDLKIYREWLSYQQAQPEHYYFIETLLRKYIYDLIKNQDKELEKIYEHYLLQAIRSSYSAVQAYAVYQLCLLWNSQANKYFPSNQPDYDYISSSYTIQKDFDTGYRYHAAKALRLFNDHKDLLDRFGYLKNILSSMESKIRNTSITISLETNNLPGAPVLAELKFKNTDTLFYKIVKPPLDYSFSFRNNNELIDDLLQKPVLKETYVVLPGVNDFNYHNVYIDIDTMPVGHYAMVFSPKPLRDSNVLRHNIYFNITNIAVVNNDKRVYILDRKDGKPLAGAAVKAWYEETVKTNTGNNFVKHEKKYTVNQQGFIEINNSNYNNLIVSYGADTLKENISYNEYEKPEDVYSTEEYDDLVEYYEENANAYIYTDRSIYRPGQTVFYKAIFITKNKNTGEPMLMTKKNLKGKIFGNVFKKLLKEEEPLLYVTDPFNKEMDSLRIIPDEFGTVQGSFKIPLTAATGDWEIAPDYIEQGNNTGSFKVEEYKRPTYEIEIEKPKKELKLGDTFSVKVKLRSFAGATLNNVKIRYDIKRSGNFYEYDSATMQMLSKTGSSIIVDTTAFTGNNGELNVIVSDNAVLEKRFDPEHNWYVDYYIAAEAIDATGESYDKAITVSLVARPVNIRLTMENQYNRNDLKPITVTTTDKNAGTVDKKVNARIYRISGDTQLFNNRAYTKADVWLYDKTILQNKFPFDNLLKQEPAETKELVYEKIINTGDKEKIQLNAALLTAGNYKLEVICKEGEKITGEIVKNFSVYDLRENKLPGTQWSFDHTPFTYALPGEKIKYYYGNSYGPAYTIFHVVYFSGKKKRVTKYFYDQQWAAKGLGQYDLPIPANATDQVKLTQLYVLNNQLLSNTETIYITAAPNSEPEIIVEKYRKKLTPGANETFAVSIKTKNEHTAAELMTTLYDASLDKLEPHQWKKPNEYRRSGYISLDWPKEINQVQKSYEPYYYRDIIPGQLMPANTIAPLWWLNPLDYAYDQDILGDWNNSQRSKYNFQSDFNPNARYSLGLDADGDLLKQLPGMTLGKTQGLNEVVVTAAFSTTRSKQLTGSVSGIYIRGASTSNLLAYSQPLIILDGVIYEAALGAIDPKTITSGLVLKGADAAALYGARAANGVLILSTKGEIVLPAEPEPVIMPRKNFNETAFFFPAIHAGKDGYYSFSFTMPESVTEWHWKLLAHTKKALFAYTERKLNTQLPLMVQPNMPRLLYQGDKIILQSRISNLDSLAANGKIICRIEDAVTGNDITAQFTGTAQNNFSVTAKQNTTAAFTITVPATQLNPVKISITVRSQNFADGEEYVIPILSPKIFIRDNLPFYVQQNSSVLALPALPYGAEIFGVGLSVQAKPQAALLNSLPTLAHYPYGCAEQTFNKLLAYTTAYKLIRTDEATRRSFEKAKQAVEKETVLVKLPDELSETTMPWLNLNNQTAKEQHELFRLLDTTQSTGMIEKLVERLEKLQNADGGISWFDGGKSSGYMSNYVLKGFGKLTADKQLLPNTVFEGSAYRKFIDKLVAYCDDQFLISAKTASLYNDLFYPWSRSYLLTYYPLADSMRQKIKEQLLAEWKKKQQGSLYRQALLITNSFKYAAGEQDELYQNAVAGLSSIRQLAIEDEAAGLRWKELADNDDLSYSAEETIALLAEAFTLNKKDDTVNRGIIKWLFTAKNEHSWSSTKATAAVINLIADQNKTVIGETQTVQISIDKKQLAVSNDLLQGNLFDYTTAATLPATIAIKKENSNAAAGNLYRYYFTAAVDSGLVDKQLQLTKQWYKWNTVTNNWEIILPGSILKIADKIKVTLTVQSSKPLQYVFINDKRAAAFEPINNSSGYEYNDGINYYQSVRDEGSQFFIDFIPAGRHQVSYEMKVAQQGSFTNGPAVLQCMYRPDITAYSTGLKAICEE